MTIVHERHAAAHPPHAVAEGPPGASTGWVVLDIGGDIGAAVIFTGGALDAAEIEIRRCGSPWDGTHVAVRARPSPGGPVFAAVFGQLNEGCYEMRLRPADPHGEVRRIDVTGGQLCHHDWSC
jgi:hypothetical protein